MTAHPTPDAETLACALAGRYAGRWARSVVRLAAEAGGSAAPWFVDGFAGADLQRAALRSASLQPAAIAAVQALGPAVGGGASIVLIEEDPGLIARLVEELHGIGVGERVRLTADAAFTAPGEIALVEAPFTAVAARLAEGIGDEPALVRLAPLTARALPWAALQAIAALPSADLLLRFPHEDFAKQARFAGPLADLPPHVRRLVEGCSALLADARHDWIAEWRQVERGGGPDAALAAMVARMDALLESAAPERFTRPLRVDGGADAIHLLLSTPAADRTLEPGAGGDDDHLAVDPPAPAPEALSGADLPPADEPSVPAETAAILDLFADAEAPGPEPASPGKPRSTTPRQRKPRQPGPDVPGLFDEPEG